MALDSPKLAATKALPKRGAWATTSRTRPKPGWPAPPRWPVAGGPTGTAGCWPRTPRPSPPAPPAAAPCHRCKTPPAATSWDQVPGRLGTPPTEAYPGERFSPSFRNVHPGHCGHRRSNPPQAKPSPFAASNTIAGSLSQGRRRRQLPTKYTEQRSHYCGKRSGVAVRGSPVGRRPKPAAPTPPLKKGRTCNT